MNISDPGAEDLLSRIRVLSQIVWEDSVKKPDIDLWLENFQGENQSAEIEKINALHLLAHFNFFGLKEIRILLKTLYRDLFQYPIIQEIRQLNHGTKDIKKIHIKLDEELSRTKFLGVGNPSESGSHLLYYFRQENSLRKNYFINQHEIIDPESGKIAIQDLTRLVFIDDILGSGQQVIQYSKNLISNIRDAAAIDGREIEILYYVLFAKPEGLQVARGSDSLFDRVEAVHEMATSESAFSEGSRVYSDCKGEVTLKTGRDIAFHYGLKLQPDSPLGYRDGQLLLGLHHNVPDNTLPIFWTDEAEKSWTPVFPRYKKVY
ncbi:hypothetical protein ABZU78_10730 [Rhodococcus erythropolis]|uniref:phosphoribosyltransferase-like protein n=1 Tax=Rhodococcus erythropolis TaxID=1833 RepID=UPI00339E66E5